MDNKKYNALSRWIRPLKGLILLKFIAYTYFLCLGHLPVHQIHIIKTIYTLILIYIYIYKSPPFHTVRRTRIHRISLSLHIFVFAISLNQTLIQSRKMDRVGTRSLEVWDNITYWLHSDDSWNLSVENCRLSTRPSNDVSDRLTFNTKLTLSNDIIPTPAWNCGVQRCRLVRYAL